MIRTNVYLGIAFAVVGTAFGQSGPGIKQVEVSPTSAGSGQEMYTQYCAVCHGKDGKGNGPAVRALKKQPTDLTMLAKNEGGKFPARRVYASISGQFNLPSHGSGDMPIWGNVFREMSRGNDAQVKLRLADLTKYIESLQAK